MSEFSGNKIKELRTAKNMTQVEFAKALKVKVQNVPFWESGREPSYETLIKIADLFEVSTDVLMGHPPKTAWADRMLDVLNEQLPAATAHAMYQLALTLREPTDSLMDDLGVPNNEREEYISRNMTPEKEVKKEAQILACLVYFLRSREFFDETERQNPLSDCAQLVHTSGILSTKYGAMRVLADFLKDRWDKLDEISLSLLTELAKDKEAHDAKESK